MRRRQFVGLTIPLAFIALGVHGASAFAQARPGKLKRVGFLAASGAGSGVNLTPWLAELGYRDGENIRFEYRFPAGRDDALAALAADLVQQKLDVIVASGLPAIRAAAQATKKSPMAGKVHAAYAKFQQLLQDWGRISAGAYHQLVAG